MRVVGEIREKFLTLEVDQADLVLLCISQKYKDSPTCRLEGEYCVAKKVSVIPLLLQANFKPDGWYVQFYFYISVFYIIYFIM
jgi:hypothetical protein